MPRRQLFMIKSFDVITNCFMSADFFFDFQYVVITKLINCTDEAMKAETRIHLIKGYYVTVVFLAQ